MKKIFLIILFPLMVFAQLQKPSTNINISDSLSLKYISADSINLKSNYNALTLTPNYNNTIALGALSLGNWTTGTLNNDIAIGQESGYNISANSANRNQNNIFVGQYAGLMDFGLSPIITFAHNIGIGDNALRSAFQGSNNNQNYNVSIGYYNSYQLTNATQNNSIGFNEGYQATLSYSNLLGSNPFLYPLSGNYNNYIGYNVGGNNTGNYNYWNGTNIASASALTINNTIIEGKNPYLPSTNFANVWIVGNGDYYPTSNPFVFDFAAHNLTLAASVTIDSGLTTTKINGMPVPDINYYSKYIPVADSIQLISGNTIQFDSLTIPSGNYLISGWLLIYYSGNNPGNGLDIAVDTVRATTADTLKARYVITYTSASTQYATINIPNNYWTLSNTTKLFLNCYSNYSGRLTAIEAIIKAIKIY